MKKILGWPEAKKGTLFLPSEIPEYEARNNNPAYECGCGITILIITTNEVWSANLGDSRAVAHTMRGTGKYAV